MRNLHLISILFLYKDVLKCLVYTNQLIIMSTAFFFSQLQFHAKHKMQCSMCKIEGFKHATEFQQHKTLCMRDQQKKGIPGGKVCVNSKTLLWRSVWKQEKILKQC